MKRCKWISVLMAIVLLLQVLSPLGALANNQKGTKPPAENSLEYRVVNNALSKLLSGQQHADVVWKKDLSSAEKEALLRYLSPEFYKEGKKGDLVALKIVAVTPGNRFPGSDDLAARGRHPSPQWGWPHVYITNVRWRGRTFQLARRVRGWGPGTVRLSVTETVSNRWGAQARVSAQVVSASVGFDVPHSTAWQSGFSLNIPAGQEYELDAYNVYGLYGFSAYYNPLIGHAYYIGSGWAQSFFTVSYWHWRVH